MTMWRDFIISSHSAFLYPLFHGSWPLQLSCSSFLLPPLCFYLIISSSSFFIVSPPPSAILPPLSSSCKATYQNLTMTFVCIFWCPPQAFMLPDDLLGLEKLRANGQASCLPPWRPTTCQVTVATTEEGTGPMAIDTYPPTRLLSVMCDLHPRFLS